MAFTPEQVRRIEIAIKRKMPGGLLMCAMCHSSTLILGNGYARISLQLNLQTIQLDAPGLPSITLVCTNCGYTHLFNVIALGLTDLGPVTPDPPR